MKLKQNATEEKITGTYYTPYKMADFIVSNLVSIDKKSYVLEPSCGDGVFYDALRFRETEFKEADFVEINKEACEVLKEKNQYTNLFVSNCDFFDFLKANKKRYDCIIGNPPYIRYQYLNEQQRKEISELLNSNGMKPNKLTNAWVAFVVGCTTLLSESGELALVIPGELLSVGYASQLRSYLLREYEEINVYTFRKLIFEDLQQDTIILHCKKKSDKKGIRIVESDDIESLINESLESFDYHDFPENVKLKWVNFLSKKGDSTFKNLPFVKLNKYCLINVGLTTGNNAFFSLDSDRTQRYELEKYVVPLVGKSSHAKCCVFTQNDYLTNLNEGKNSNLLLIPDVSLEQLPAGLKKYLEIGVSSKINEGYKCAIRKHWYCIPSIWYPDAFFQRRCGDNPKLVLNDCHAISTDTMHRLKFYDESNKKLITSIFYNSVTFASAEMCGRSYGGGVLEILPSEAGEVMIPDVELIKGKIDVDAFLEQIDLLIRNSDSYDNVVRYVDKTILIDILGLSSECCEKYFLMWKDMLSRRLSRSK